MRTGFGENYSQTGTQDLSFTGQNQDAESSGASGVGGLYDFLYRKQSPVQGRWLSPDPAGLAAANPSDPQSWNRYAYVGNRSLSLTDPLGLVEMPCDPWSLSCPGDPNPGPCNVSDPSCGGPCYPTVSLCIPDPPGGLGGGGGGGGGYAAGTQRSGGRWPGNVTLGLPGGLNQFPLGLGDLIGLAPGSGMGCEFGNICDPIDLSFVAGVDDAIEIYAAARGIALAIIIGKEIYDYTMAKRDLKAFKEAIRQIEKICGFHLSDAQIEQLHEHITKQRYTLPQIIEDGVNLFCPDKWPG